VPEIKTIFEHFYPNGAKALCGARPYDPAPLRFAGSHGGA